MALRVLTRVPYGNATRVSVHDNKEIPEVHFIPAPHGAPEALWFCFRVVESDSDKEHPGKFKLVLRNFGNMLGASDPAMCIPVCRPAGQGWVRMKTGAAERDPDGRISASWALNYPAPYVDIAFCFPYGRHELKSLVRKSRGDWHLDEIGVSQAGKPIWRVANDYGTDPKRPGLYFIARQHAGETPGSWVLDGVLDRFSRAKLNPFTIWCIPFGNIDGIERGDYGKDSFPIDVNRAWGVPPLRHENLVIQRDIERWRERCEPYLALDFHAPGAFQTEGVYTYVPADAPDKSLEKSAEKWNNVLEDALGKDYAADNFARVSDYPSRWSSPSFGRYMRSMGIDCLSLETPYSMVGNTVLTTRRYREIGRHIADAILRRHGI